MVRPLLRTGMPGNTSSVSPAESYELHLQTGTGEVTVPDPAATECVSFETELLKYTNNYTLSGLPPGFEYGANYIWYVSVHSPTAGTGTSWWHPIIFIAPG